MLLLLQFLRRKLSELVVGHSTVLYCSTSLSSTTCKKGEGSMGCVTSASSAATSTAAAPIPTPTLYFYFADRILATKHNGTDGPNEMDKRYLRQCAKSDLIAPEHEPSLLELALFSPWFE